VPIILHTDHCAKKLLPWFDGLIEANEDYFAKYGEPLFTSHMLDLSEETMEENLELCKHYLKKMAAIDCFLEMEIGITGGEVRTHPRHAPSLCSETRQQMLLLV
jgi:fructose-bisphosphate aldolase class II